MQLPSIRLKQWLSGQEAQLRNSSSTQLCQLFHKRGLPVPRIPHNGLIKHMLSIMRIEWMRKEVMRQHIASTNVRA